MNSSIVVAGSRVLVVDDDRQTVNAIWGALLDCRVARELSGKDVLTRLERGERYDVIFCALMMREMTGAELFLRVARIDAAQAERIVFITEEGGLSDEFLAEHRGIVMPFEAKDVRAAAATVIDDLAHVAA
jgi:two-component system, NtrC family, sensor kinase